MNKLMFNYGQTDITPSEHLLLAGFANRKGLSGEVHRRLTSRCLVLKLDETVICLIANDLMDVEPVIIREIATVISQRTGLSDESIIITSIHTHSAPLMDYGRSDANDRFIGFAVQRIAENAAGVINDKSGFNSGFIKLGKAVCDINIARRDIKPEGGGMAYRVGDIDGLRDEEVLIMEISDYSGSKKVTLFNYACHPVTLGYGSNYLSTDYPGKAREVVENAKGGIAIFMNGATGDLNPRNDNNTDPGITDQEGEKLGMAVISAILAYDNKDIDLKTIAGVIQIPFRDQNITKEHIANEVRRKTSDITEFFTWKEMLNHWAEKVYEMIDKDEVKNAFPFKINTVKLGKAILFFTQGELFVRYQVELKKRFPEYYMFCIGYVHGTGAYIPTADVFENKGYEADQAYIYEVLPSPLSPQIEKIYLDNVIDTIKTLISR
jgi:neutral ceramidase